MSPSFAKVIVTLTVTIATSPLGVAQTDPAPSTPETALADKLRSTPFTWGPDPDSIQVPIVVNRHRMNWQLDIGANESVIYGQQASKNGAKVGDEKFRANIIEGAFIQKPFSLQRVTLCRFITVPARRKNVRKPATGERRHNTVVSELAGYPIVPAAGGWSLLIDVEKLGLDAETASERLLRLGKVAATPMTHWGERVAPRHVRFVFSNEPVDRLRGVRDRVRRAVG